MTRLSALFVLLGLVVASPTDAQTGQGGAGAPVASPSAQTSASIPPTPVDYVVGAQDVLRVTVFDEPTMSGSYRVDPDGSFQYPMLGRVRAAGRTPREIADDVKAKLEDGYIRYAQVRVDVEQFRSRSIFIVGEVRAPGKYPMTGDMTLIEALAAAGSTTPAASVEVLILRPRIATATQPLTPEQSDQANVTRVSLADLQLGRLSENVRLNEGDTIFVPKAEKFFMTGQVRNPGAYTYERNLTVLQAISLAGGLTDKGSNRRLKVIRTVNGKKVEQGVDLADTIQPGDTIVVPQRLL
jgi:polysaccharide export outer membrane protein